MLHRTHVQTGFLRQLRDSRAVIVMECLVGKDCICHLRVGHQVDLQQLCGNGKKTRHLVSFDAMRSTLSDNQQTRRNQWLAIALLLLQSVAFYSPFNPRIRTVVETTAQHPKRVP